ncbi:Hsp20/alpha crystallin family protein [Neomoorella mulderi]|uniref:18 kDa heat shock protein n=1 Tax=Moorella mulderi DSM 14980 TaxID=1122241 RepID=A0A151AT46_9FIRM|nr:Hsp20/alpha crystallin family protein [Moorella mulderi]KYH30821.1 18 kDa heat shock protein [Moorella mulderi DSM 14980]
MLQPQNWSVPAMMPPGWMATPADGFVPPVDVLESNNDLIYIFAIPGARPENVRVEVRQQALEIEGNASLPDGGQYVYRYQEWPAGRFYRFLPLPPEIDAEKAAASFNQGLLTVRFPKTARGRQIAINVQAPVQQQGQENTAGNQPGSPGRTHLI